LTLHRSQLRTHRWSHTNRLHHSNTKAADLLPERPQLHKSSFSRNTTLGKRRSTTAMQRARAYRNLASVLASLVLFLSHIPILKYTEACFGRLAVAIA